MLDDDTVRREILMAMTLAMVPRTCPATVNEILHAADRLGVSGLALAGMDDGRLVRHLSADALQTLRALSPDMAENAYETLGRVASLGGRVLVAGRTGYPERLHGTLGAAAPPLLFVLGDARLLEGPAASVVGTRRVSAAGAQAAWHTGGALAEAGVTVISGGAYGTDREAHSAAIAAGGATVMVLAQGLLTYEPPGWLVPALESGAALLVSTFGPGGSWTASGALARNETIAALGRVVVAVEPRRTGGTIRTVEHALRLGRPVFVHFCPEEATLRGELLARGVKEMPANGGEEVARLARTESLSDTGSGEPRLF